MNEENVSSLSLSNCSGRSCPETSDHIKVVVRIYTNFIPALIPVVLSKAKKGIHPFALHDFDIC
jgi:hypothetical protein